MAASPASLGPPDRMPAATKTSFVPPNRTHAHNRVRLTRMLTLTTNVSKAVAELPPAAFSSILHPVPVVNALTLAILVIRDVSRISKLSLSSSSPSLIFRATRTLMRPCTFVRNAYNTTLRRCIVRRVALE